MGMSRLPPSPSFSTVVSCLPIPPWNLHTVADTVSLVRTVAESRLSLRLSISANTLSQTTSISTCSTRVHHQVNLVPSSGSSRKQRMRWRDSTSWPSRSWKTTDQNRLFSWIFTSVWKPWTPLPSPPVPRRFLLVSDSTRLPSRRRPRICLVDGVCEWLWPRLSSSSPLFFFSMTQQHIWIWKPAWLEEYLKKWDRTLVLVSHSMDFLNGVCTNMIDMRQKQLIYYGGNYDSYSKTRSEQEVNQMKAYTKQQDEIVHIKKFIASAGTYANLVRQAKSRQKILDKMEADGLIQKVDEDRVFTFRFADVEKLPPPVLSFDDVTFSYSGNAKDDLYKHLDLGVDMDSRTALVGPNGVGKSTLLRLMTGKPSPTGGVVSRHTHLKMGVYSQHSSEQLDLTKSALDFVRDKYADKSQDYQYWRQQLGKYGLSGESQTALMGTLSEGQKSRIVFALLAIDGPNMLLLDEPTNGLDIPTIDSLADAINAFTGGVVVVSHDFRLLDKIAKDIMVCENQTIKEWDGSIGEYKNYLRKKMINAGAV